MIAQIEPPKRASLSKAASNRVFNWAGYFRDMWVSASRAGTGSILAFSGPTIARIRGTERMDAFEKVGEPMTVRHLCPDGARALFGEVPPPLTPMRVALHGEFVP